MLCYMTFSKRLMLDILFSWTRHFFFLIIVKMAIEFERDQNIIENRKTKRKTLLLHRCASHKFHLIDVPKTRDQIPSDQRRSRCEWSNCLLWIPFILISGSPNECRLHTCDACIIITWRWKLRATLVARNKSG